MVTRIFISLVLATSLLGVTPTDDGDCTPDPAWPENYCEGDDPPRPDDWPVDPPASEPDPAPASAASPAVVPPTFTG